MKFSFSCFSLCLVICKNERRKRKQILSNHVTLGNEEVDRVKKTALSLMAVGGLGRSQTDTELRGARSALKNGEIK